MKRDDTLLRVEVERLFTVSPSQWPCSFWSREDQIEALCDGWAMNIDSACIFNGVEDDEERFSMWFRFETNEEAIEHVVKRAQEGSDLHCRALVLHVAAKLTNGVLDQ